VGGCLILKSIGSSKLNITIIIMAQNTQTDIKEENKEEDNRCMICGIDMGSCNPRQLCCKTYCPNEFEIEQEDEDDEHNDSLLKESKKHKRIHDEVIMYSFDMKEPESKKR
jgi:hypothetical protein